MSWSLFPPLTGDMDGAYLFDGILRSRGSMSLADLAAYGVCSCKLQIGNADFARELALADPPAKRDRTAISERLETPRGDQRFCRNSKLTLSGVHVRHKPVRVATDDETLRTVTGPCRATRTHQETPSTPKPGFGPAKSLRLKATWGGATWTAIVKGDSVIACVRNAQEYSNGSELAIRPDHRGSS